MQKSNCYECQNRGTVPGSANSRCTVFTAKQGIGILAAGVRIVMTTPGKPDVPLLKQNQQGVDGGWCNWPLDFDPVWISECLIFNPKTDKDGHTPGAN